MVFSIGMKRLTFSPDNLYTQIRDIIEVLEDLESVEENQSEIRLMKTNRCWICLPGVHFLLFQKTEEENRENRTIDRTWNVQA